MTALVDSHAHLEGASFAEDLDVVIARALDAGVATIISAGVDLQTSVSTVELAERYDSVWAAVGIHPHDTAAASKDDLAELRKLASHPKVIAIGEIGLDYYRNHSPRETQRDWFERLLDIAAELNLPVCVHARDAYDDVLAALASWRSKTSLSNPGMLHCFAGSESQANEAIDLGMFISIAGPITYPSADELASIVRALPLESLLTETDCPYLTPQSARGKRNEPAMVTEVASKIAELQGTDFETVASATAASARRLFGIAL